MTSKREPGAPPACDRCHHSAHDGGACYVEVAQDIECACPGSTALFPRTVPVAPPDPGQALAEARVGLLDARGRFADPTAAPVAGSASFSEALDALVVAASHVTYGDGYAVVGAARARVESLHRDEVASARKLAESAIAGALGAERERDEARAERDRLAAALRSIAAETFTLQIQREDNVPDDEALKEWINIALRYRAVARAALAALPVPDNDDAKEGPDGP